MGAKGGPAAATHVVDVAQGFFGTGSADLGAQLGERRLHRAAHRGHGLGAQQNALADGALTHDDAARRREGQRQAARAAVRALVERREVAGLVEELHEHAEHERRRERRPYPVRLTTPTTKPRIPTRMTERRSTPCPPAQTCRTAKSGQIYA
jgi:hypothetical protein